MKNIFILFIAFFTSTLAMASAGTNQFKAVCQVMSIHVNSAATKIVRVSDCKIIDVGVDEIGKLNEAALVDMSFEIRNSVLASVKPELQRAINTGSNVEVTLESYFFNHLYTKRTKGLKLLNITFPEKSFNVPGMYINFTYPCAASPSSFQNRPPFTC